MDEAQYYKNFWLTPPWAGRHPNSDEWARWSEIFKILPTSNHPRYSVLDCGCGRGWMTELLSRIYPNVSGIDPNDVSRAKHLFPELNFRQESARGHWGRYDLVVCSEVIEHIDGKADFVFDILRLLEWGGYAILTTPNPAVRDHFQPSQPVEQWLTKTELEALFSGPEWSVEHYSTVQWSFMPVYQLIKVKKMKVDSQ